MLAPIDFKSRELPILTYILKCLALVPTVNYEMSFSKEGIHQKLKQHVNKTFLPRYIEDSLYCTANLCVTDLSDFALLFYSQTFTSNFLIIIIHI